MKEITSDILRDCTLDSEIARLAGIPWESALARSPNGEISRPIPWTTSRDFNLDFRFYLNESGIPHLDRDSLRLPIQPGTATTISKNYCMEQIQTLGAARRFMISVCASYQSDLEFEETSASSETALSLEEILSACYGLNSKLHHAPFSPKMKWSGLLKRFLSLPGTTFRDADYFENLPSLNLPHNTYLFGCQLQFRSNATCALAQPFLSVVQIQETDVEYTDDIPTYRNNVRNCVLPETRLLLSSTIAVMLLAKLASTDYQPRVNMRAFEPWMSAYGLLILPTAFFLFSIGPQWGGSSRNSRMETKLITYARPTFDDGDSPRFSVPKIMYEFRQLSLEVQERLAGLVDRSLPP